MRVYGTLVWPALALAAVIVHNGVSLARNYFIACRIGLPIRVIPFDHTNPLWLGLDRKVLSYVRRLPGFLGDNSFTRYNFRAWEMYDRLRPHQEMGDAFIIVTPARIWFYRTRSLLLKSLWLTRVRQLLAQQP